jgi:hypothetical protein
MPRSPRRSFWENKYRSVTQAFQSENYREAISESQNLFLEILADLITGLENELDEPDKPKLAALVDTIGHGLPLRRFNLEQFSKLYSEFQILERLASKDPAQAHLANVAAMFNLAGISNLFVYLRRASLDQKSGIRGAVQHLIVALGAFLQYDDRATLVRLEIIQNREAIEDDLRAYLDTRNKIIEMLGLDPSRDEQAASKVFDLIKERGLLFNRSDKSRNVSFKVATLVNLLRHIYIGIKSMLKDEKEVDRIFEKAGYSCGIKFGAQMYETSQLSRYEVSDTDIVERWCEFDSDVGFGRFHNNLKFERSEHKLEVTGSINLSDNFLITSKTGEGVVHLCPFMTGYIQGVLEMMFRATFEVTHKIENCEQGSPGNRESVFDVRMSASNGGARNGNAE